VRERLYRSPKTARTTDSRHEEDRDGPQDQPSRRKGEGDAEVVAPDEGLEHCRRRASRGEHFAAWAQARKEGRRAWASLREMQAWCCVSHSPFTKCAQSEPRCTASSSVERSGSGECSMPGGDRSEYMETAPVPSAPRTSASSSPSMPRDSCCFQRAGSPGRPAVPRCAWSAARLFLWPDQWR
jgi:hypothetical protein